MKMLKLKSTLLSGLAIAGLLAPTLVLAAKPDPELINAIRDQGFNHSQVVQTLQHLTDKIGPRLTNSPTMREASRWTREQLQAWGMANAHLENFDFGRGWSYDRASIDMLAPRKTSLHGIPVAWTPGTAGPVEAEVVYLDAVTVEELQKYRGKLKGKVVMLSEPIESTEAKREISKRYSAGELAEMRNFDIKAPASDAEPQQDGVAQRRKMVAFSEAREAFIKAEGAKGALIKSFWDGGLIVSSGQNYRVGKTFPLPMLTLSAEHYNLLARTLEAGVTPKITFNVEARFHDEDMNGQNTIAEIPGAGEKPEIIMLGAHLDSWHGATGGVDNAAGVAITMEAMRILKAVGLHPKRTIRIGLWSGEEQGLNGSAAYVEQHFASRPGPADPKERAQSRWLWSSAGWPITKKPEYDLLSAYFNIDNGAGRLRGIYAQGNAGAKATFGEWFAAVGDISEGTITTNNTGSTDHVSFDRVGLPGFQFIQDPLDYFTRLHHTDSDTYDHALPDDMKQAAVVLATIVYQAAQADNRMPRKPMPTEPTADEKKAEAQKADKRARGKERKALSDLK
ncbi:MAG TPA: M20/M25/M40 family metallo-hydrolase [Burkholderiaceae bacterium]